MVLQKMLKAKIIAKGYDVNEFLAEIKMSTTQWYARLNGTVDFTRNEIENICQKLSLTDEELLQIFFA